MTAVVEIINQAKNDRKRYQSCERRVLINFLWVNVLISISLFDDCRVYFVASRFYLGLFIMHCRILSRSVKTPDLVLPVHAFFMPMTLCVLEWAKTDNRGNRPVFVTKPEPRKELYLS